MSIGTETQTVTGPSSGARWVRRLTVAVVTLVLVLGGWAGHELYTTQTYHFAAVDPPKLYRCGNRGLREFEHAVNQCAARTVVSFVTDREVDDPATPQFKAESDYCRDHGIRQVRLPVPRNGYPTSDQVQTFLGIVADPVNRPVLMHCAQGVRRTGMFMAAYQLSILDRSVAVTKERITPWGHKAKDLDDVRTFIDHYDPVNAVVPTTMPAGSDLGGD